MSRSATPAKEIEDPFERVPDGARVAPTFHFKGCPAERLEEFEAVKPAAVDGNGLVVAPARRVRVVRCIDCAAEVVFDDDGTETFVDPAEPGSVASRPTARKVRR